MKQYKSEIICTRCGGIATIIQSYARKKTMFTSLNHVCLNCGMETKFIVVDDVSKAKSILSFTTDLSINQEIVLDLLNGKNGKVLKKIIK